MTTDHMFAAWLSKIAVFIAMAHIFISYSRADSAALRQLADVLETSGHSVWWDVHSIQGGADWQLAISRGIVDADLILLLLSSNSLRSKWVQEELAIANSKFKIIIPIKLDSVSEHYVPKFINDEHVNVLDATSGISSIAVKLLDDLKGIATESGRSPFAVNRTRLTHFVGHHDDFRQIHALLSAPMGIRQARVAVCGMGGIGKTQLCIEYAHRYRYFYPDGVFFFDAAQDLNGQVIHLVPLLAEYGLGKRCERTEQENQVDCILGTLALLKRAVLIFDNVPTARFFRTAIVGSNTPLSSIPLPVLLNSRELFEGNDIHTFEIATLTDHEAVQVLSQGRPDLLDKSETVVLSKMLGNVPLALALAAAFLARKPSATPEAYRRELEANGWESTMALGRVRVGDIEAYGDASFAPALRAQWGLLETESAKDILSAIALHKLHDRVPLSRLSLMTALEDSVNGIKTPLADAIRDARTANLVTLVNAKHLSMHAIVHDFVRRHAFVDFENEKHKRVMNTLSTLASLEFVERLVLQYSLDAAIGDLIEIGRLARLCRLDTAILDEWMSMLQSHSHVFRIWATQPSLANFAHHVLLAAQLKGLPRLESLAQLKCKDGGNSYFSRLWSSWIPPMQLRTKLAGHRGDTTWIVASADGNRAVACNKQNMLTQWELPTGRLEGTLQLGSAQLAAISPAGERLAVITTDGLLQLYDLDERTCIHLESIVGQTFSSIFFSSEVTLIGLSRDFNALISIDLVNDSFQSDRSIPEEVDRFFELPNQELLLGQKNGRFCLYDATAHRVLRSGQLPDPEEHIYAAHSSGKDILAITTKGLARFHGQDVSVEILNGTFAVGPQWRPSPSFFANGNYAVCALNQNTLQIVDTRNPVTLWLLPSDTVDNITAGSRTTVFVSGNSEYSELNVWDFAVPPESVPTKPHRREIVRLLTLDQGNRFVSTSMDWSAALWDRREGKKIKTYQDFLGGYAKGLAKTVADDRFLVGYTFFSCVYDAATGEELYRWEPPCDGVTAICMAPSGSFFVTGSSDGLLLLWSDSMELISEIAIEKDGSEVTAIVISENERTIVAGDTNGNLCFINYASGAIHRISTERGLVGDICVSPDQKLVFSGHQAGQICAWDIRTGMLRSAFEAHQDRVMALTTIGELLLSASSDGSIRLWDTQSCTPSEIIVVGIPISCLDYYAEDSILLIGLPNGDVMAFVRNIPSLRPS